jgi:hypothetical protein
VVGRWPPAEVPEEGRDPAVAFHGQHHPATLVLAGGGDHRGSVAVELVAAASVDPAGVGDADAHLLLGRPRVAELLQPDRATGASAGGVEDQVCLEHLLSAAVGVSEHPDAVHAPAVGRRNQPGGVAAVDEPHVAERPHPVADALLQQGPADGEGPQVARSGAQPEPLVVPAGVGLEVAGQGPVGYQFVG